jgi:hypothetical protein
MWALASCGALTRSVSIVAFATLLTAASPALAEKAQSLERVYAEQAPGPLATTGLVLACLLLLALSVGVLTLAVRELRKDNQRRRTTYRRRIRRREAAITEPATASG